jgi:hypothetical protein
MAAPVITNMLFIIESGGVSIPPDPASVVRLDITLNKTTLYTGVGNVPTIVMDRSSQGPDIALIFDSVSDVQSFGFFYSVLKFTAVVDTSGMHGETYTVNSASAVTDFDQFTDVDGTPIATTLPPDLLSVLYILGVPVTSEGHIHHRFTASGPNDPTVEISSDAINDSFIVNGGDDGQVMARDPFQPDGWGFVDRSAFVGPAGPVGPTGSVNRAWTQLTHAQILTLATVPVELVPAISDAVVLPLGWFIEGDTAAGAYTLTPDTLLCLRYAPETSSDFYNSISAGHRSGFTTRGALTAGDRTADFFWYGSLGDPPTGGWDALQADIVNHALTATLKLGAGEIGQESLYPDQVYSSLPATDPVGGDPANTLTITVWYVVVKPGSADIVVPVDSGGVVGPTGLTGPDGPQGIQGLQGIQGIQGPAPDITFGSITGTATEGNDARLSDARVPTIHASTHGAGQTDPITIAESQVTSLVADLETLESAATIETAARIAADATKVGTSDSRLSNARTPTAHEATHLAGGTDPLVGLSPSQVTGTAVVTADSRLSDARTPIAHSATHGAGQTDTITIAESQVTNLVTDLAAEAAARVAGDAAITDATLPTSDIVTNNASTTKHGFLPKLSNSVADFLTGTGVFANLVTTQTNTATGNAATFTLAGYPITMVRFTGASALTNFGFTAVAGGHILILVNASAFTWTINNDDAGASISNRILTGTGAAVVLAATTGWAILIKDGTTNRWRMLARG